MQVVKGRVMPRPCQKRRARVAAQRGTNAKPAPPPPIPKSKPSARGKPQRGRGRGRGGRGGNFGGRPTRGQSSYDGAQEFRSFVEAQRSGNQFGALNSNARAGGGSSFDPIMLDNSDDSDLEEGELTDDGSDMDDSMSDLDTDDSADDMMINLGEIRPQKGRLRRAEVMFTALEAVSIYDTMHQAGFPLASRKMGRFDASGQIVEVEIAAFYSHAHSHTFKPNTHIKFTEQSNTQTLSTTTDKYSTRSSAYVSDFPRGQRPATDNPAKVTPRLPEHDFVKDYVFDWGKFKNSHISDVPESYLRTIGGQPFVFDGRHPGLKEAFDHHRPELRQTATNIQPPAQAPVQAPRRTRGNASAFEKFKLPKGAFKGKRLDEVEENYIKTLEGMPTVINSWPGLKEALADFNEKTGRQGKSFAQRKFYATIAMVETRGQSKNFEPIELPRVAHRKRKQSNDTIPAPDTAQPPNQSSTKRRKKVKSTAKVDASAAPAASVPVAQASALSPPPTIEFTPVNATDHTARKLRARGKVVVEPKRNGPGHNRTTVEVDLTNSSDDEPAQRSRPVASHTADDEDADSRYTLAPRRKGRKKAAGAPATQQTAELKFEEDGLEEVDKAEAAVAAVADASSRTTHKGKKPDHLLRISISDVKVNRVGQGIISEASGRSRDQAKQGKDVPPQGVPSRAVMFTIGEAVKALSLYKNGTMSVPTAIDPQSRQPYAPLPIGEFLAYPVTRTYHLGALGRFDIDTTYSLPFCLTVPLSEHSYIHGTCDISAAESSRHGLGFLSAVPTRPQGPTVRRPNNYCFTFGRYRGRRMDSVPISYLRSIFNSNEYHNDVKLQRAFVDLYPKGLYESEAESYTLEKGGFKGKRFDEVPKSYLWGLLRKKNEGLGEGATRSYEGLKHLSAPPGQIHCINTHQHLAEIPHRPRFGHGPVSESASQQGAGTALLEDPLRPFD
ncbi:hypothetical protein OPT61_g1468 [Boeremia exigua]|uniref:Uncharacterized protein n=1 Tax=Boeremia exigua TaxID=749465 RepID=A0ACC2IQ14_9PLEO|nr:hypothetical protein OPT61_g1468 [Boeremia exigua]